LYIGNSNLISNLSKGVCRGVLLCYFGEFGGGFEMVEEVEDGGEGGGESPFPPFPFGVLSPLSPLPFGRFDISPCNLAFLFSNKNFTISLISHKYFLKVSSS
jgi:hypothetical protein